MTLRALAIAAALLLAVTTAGLADPRAVCNPAANATFAVTGVARNDMLNLRAGPSASDRVVARLAHNARNIRHDGQVSHATSGCRNACFAALVGISAADVLVRAECTSRSNLWYRVRDGNGNRGWAAARFLASSGNVPAPQPPVIQGDSYDYRCDGGGRISLTVRERAGEADFVDHLGQKWRLIRERGMNQPLSFRGMDNNREMFLRGDRRLVRFSNARGNVNTCRL